MDGATREAVVLMSFLIELDVLRMQELRSKSHE